MTSKVNAGRGPSRSRPVRLLLILAGALGGAALSAHVVYSAAYYISNYEPEDQKVFEDGFEKADLAAWRDGEIEFCCDHSAVFVGENAREGKRALKIALRAEDPRMAGSKRAELRLKAVPLGDERWYAFSIFVPEGWKATSDPVTVAQWHAVDDKLFGESGRAPPLRLVLKDETWNVTSHWDSRFLSGIPFRTASPEDGALLWSGSLRRGAWTDWVFRVRWSYGADGSLEAWKDGVSIARREGPNTYNDWMGPFFKVGIYIPQWNKPGVMGTGEMRELIVDRVKQDIQPVPPVDKVTSSALRR